MIYGLPGQALLFVTFMAVSSAIQHKVLHTGIALCAGGFVVSGFVLGILSWGCTSTRGKISLDQILYHLRGPAISSLDGGPWWNFAQDFFLPILLCLVLVLLYLWHSGHYATPGKLNGRIARWCAARYRILTLCWILLGSGGFCYASMNHGFFSLIWYHFFESDLIDRFYQPPDPVLFTRMPSRKTWGVFPAKRRNLVLCICESMEETFARKELFGESLIPELEALQRRGMSLKGMRQVSGTHFTVASLAGMMYGMPLLAEQTVWGKKDQHALFFPEQKTLIDVLQANGYRVGFVQGGHIGFAGKEKLFRTLSPEDCISREWAESCGSYLEEERNSWGFYDSWTFARAKEKLAEFTDKQQKGTPFALIVLTVDPHEGNSLEPGEEEKFGDERDIVRLQSRRVSEFIRWVQQQPFSSNTMIVATGDHFMMREHLGPGQLSGLEDRRLFTYIWNSVISLPKSSRERPCTTLDWMPTILHGMGFSWNSVRFGLGTSLFSEARTVLEEVGEETWQAEALQHSPLYRRISGDRLDAMAEETAGNRRDGTRE